jgi:hypothetical protein
MPVKYKVQPGDCLYSIAFATGLTSDKIWSHPENAALRRKRAHPGILGKGDEIVLPDLEPLEIPLGEEPGPGTEIEGGMAQLRLRLVDAEGKPRSGIRYRLDVDGANHAAGATDGEGRITTQVPADAVQALLIVDERDRYELQLGTMEPEDAETGVAQRLFNLGFLDQQTPAEPVLQNALWKFRQKHLPDPARKPSDIDETPLKPHELAQLVKVHGS